eukprot:TRINITY_DN48528_c0_g1_i1.p1 TRINITY_DN48528_c0_g1~~TRINITY_DN48528_c0_g1_i1.p1  ORF type:complete len:552 (+),score=113.55 TRINITY_DN48528_c0_g1_i1:94-1749(+)
MGCTSSTPSSEQPSVQSRWYTSVKEKESSLSLDLSLQNLTRYLPLTIEGVPVLVQSAPGIYKADNTKLQKKGDNEAPGLKYRFQKDVEDEDGKHIVFWGSCVFGVEDGDGWLKCDLGENSLAILAQVDEASYLKSLQSACHKLSGLQSVRALASGDPLPGANGDWTSKRLGGTKSISGDKLNWRLSMDIPMKWDSATEFCVDLGGELKKASLDGNRLVWSDGDIWTRNLPEPFHRKSVRYFGEDCNKIDDKSVGYTCHKGLKPRESTPNQDAWSIVDAGCNFSLYGVFDGHGPNGHNIADLAKDALPLLLFQDPRFKSPKMEEALKHSFESMQGLIAAAHRQNRLSAHTSGSTATLVYHGRAEKSLLIAHVGDSSAVIGRASTDGDRLEAVQLTRDHKLEQDDERVRIENTGAKVIFDGQSSYRVYNKNGVGSGLNMTRSLGDLMAHHECGLIAEPEVVSHSLAPSDRMLILASDGLWTFITPQEAVSLLEGFQPEQAMEAASLLAKAAYDKWMEMTGNSAADDIVVLVVYFTGHAAVGKDPATQVSYGGA